MAVDITYPGYADKDALDRAFERIAKALVTRDAQFLFGAGMSLHAGISSGWDLTLGLLELFFPQSAKRERLEKLACEFTFESIVEAVENVLGNKRKDLTGFLQEKLDTSMCNIDELIAHKDFISVCMWGGKPLIDRIFTTNFENLLELAFTDDRVVTITEENPEDIRKAQDKGLLPIIHLHGILDKGKFLITETQLFSEHYRVLNSELRTALNNADAFVFVGYSLRDPDFLRLYMNYREDIQDRGKVDKKTYVVSPAEDQYSYKLGNEIWKSRGADWIPLSAEQFFGKMRSVMQWRADKEARRLVMERFDIKDEKAMEELLETMGKTLRTDKKEALYFLLESRRAKEID